MTMFISKNLFKRYAVRACFVAAAVVISSTAQAKVRIEVDLDAQTIHVESRAQTFDWKVSSGKPGFETPAGAFKVLWMDKDHHSDEYEQAPMPNAIFFAPGYAIHGFGKSPWGHAASHGCVRLPAAKAAILFELVKAEGADINITGFSPVTMATVRERLREKAATREASAPRVTPEEAATYSGSEMTPVRGYYAPMGSIY